MKTFEQLFCERHGCDKWRFRRTVFWKTLYPHAVPVAMIAGGSKSRYFVPDFQLIEYSARATNIRGIQEEVLDFKNAPENRKWLRRIARVRVSGTRFQRLARQYLPRDE